jgi:hypothetical protein
LSEQKKQTQRSHSWKKCSPHHQCWSHQKRGNHYYYIAATHQVVSTMLVVEQSEEGKAHGVQRPVYFLNKVLSPSKQRYPHYQKLACNMFTTWKLWQYFAVHPIIVVNKASLSNILNNPKATGCVSLWGNRTFPSRHHIWEEKGHQIPGLARFRSRVARIAEHRTTWLVECLDNIFRRVKKGPRSKAG